MRRPHAEASAVSPAPGLLAEASRRNGLIDLLRGVSILLVICTHHPLFWMEADPHMLGRRADDVRLGLGYYGVALGIAVPLRFH